MYRDRYSSNPSPLDAWLASGFPLTIAIIVINFVTMALHTFRVPVAEFLALIVPQTLHRVWTVFTYPLMSFDVIGMLFYGFMLYFIGGSLERGWGTRFYAMFFAAMTFISALGLIVGAFVLRTEVLVMNWLPLGAMLLAWCLMNAEEEIRFNFIFPIKAKWLALLEVIVIFFLHARIHPLLGFFALTGCAAALAWGRYRPWRDIGHFTIRSQPKSRVVKPGSKPRDDRFTLRDLNPFERIARWRRRRQFERLMKDD